MWHHSSSVPVSVRKTYNINIHKVLAHYTVEVVVVVKYRGLIVYTRTDNFSN